MNKKKISFFLGTFLIGALTLTFSFFATNKHLAGLAINDDYTLIFDNKTRKPNLASSLSSGEYSVNTQLDNPIVFAYNNALKNDNGFITLDNGSFLNPYKNDVKDFNAISGIKNITINFTGSETLKIEYGWQLSGLELAYVGSSNITSSLNTFNFNDEYPSYFKISNTSGEKTEILSIKIQYSCNQTIDPSYYKDLKFQMNYDKKSYYVSSCYYKATNVIVPKFYKGLPVVSIDANAFANSDVVSVVLPDGIQSIGNSAFNSCFKLASVNIPNSVASIGSLAFSGCSSLTSIKIPNSVTSLGDNAFSNCAKLVSINIPNSIKVINANLFYNCPSLTSIVIPNSVTSIGDLAFYCCSSLTSIKIPDSVTSIGKSIFSRCTKLSDVTLSNNIKRFQMKCFKTVAL